MFNVDEIRSSIQSDGVVRNHSFVVSFRTPNLMVGQTLSGLNGEQVNLNSLTRIFSVRADSVHLPGLIFPTSDSFRYGIGPSQKMPYGVAFADVPMSFILDSRGLIWSYFYAWTNLIFNFSANMNANRDPNGVGGGNPSYTLAYRDDYETDVNVDVFDPMGMTILSLRFNHAFPNLVQDIPLNWGATNEITRMGCTFTYRDWEIVPDGGSVAAAAAGSSQWRNQTQPEFSLTGIPSARPGVTL